MYPRSSRTRRVCVVSTCAADTFRRQEAALEALAPLRARRGFELAIIDLGLDAAQADRLRQEHDAQVVPARDALPTPASQPDGRVPACAVWPYVPRLVPGHDVYFGFDATPPAMDEDLFDHWIGAADADLVVLASEREAGRQPGWRIDRHEARRHARTLAAFGPSAWLAMQQHPRVRLHPWAARADHPLWAFWPAMHEAVLRRTGRTDLATDIVHLLVARGEIKAAMLAVDDRTASRPANAARQSSGCRDKVVRESPLAAKPDTDSTNSRRLTTSRSPRTA